MLKVSKSQARDHQFDQRRSAAAAAASSTSASEDSPTNSTGAKSNELATRRRFSFVMSAAARQQQQQHLKLSPPTPRRLIRMIAERRQDSARADPRPQDGGGPPPHQVAQEQANPTDQQQQQEATTSSSNSSRSPHVPQVPLPTQTGPAGAAAAAAATANDDDDDRESCRRATRTQRRRLIRSPHLGFSHKYFLLSTLGSSAVAAVAGASPGGSATGQQQQHQQSDQMNKLIAALNELSSERTVSSSSVQQSSTLNYEESRWATHRWQQQDAVWELVRTELSYINRLRLIVDLFLGTLARLQTTHGLLLEVDPRRMCSNVGQLLEANQSLYDTYLRPMVVAAAAGAGRQQLAEPALGLLRAAFANIGRLFEPYYGYCLDQLGCLQYISQLKGSNESFKVYLAWCESQRECERLRLGDLLAQPMQRLTRYPLLLKSIAKQLERPETAPKSPGEEEEEEDDQQQQQVAAAVRQTIVHVDKFVSSVDLELKRRLEFDRLQEVAGRLVSMEAPGWGDQQPQQHQQDGQACGDPPAVVRSILGAYMGQFDLMRPLFDCHSGCTRQLIFDSSAASSSAWAASDLTPHLGQIKFRDSLCSSAKPIEVILLLFTDQLFVCRPIGASASSPNTCGGSSGSLNAHGHAYAPAHAQGQRRPSPGQFRSTVHLNLSSPTTSTSPLASAGPQSPASQPPAGRPMRERAASHSCVEPLLQSASLADDEDDTTTHTHPGGECLVRQTSELNLIASERHRVDFGSGATANESRRKLSVRPANWCRESSSTAAAAAAPANCDKLQQQHHHHQTTDSSMGSSMNSSSWQFSVSSDQLDCTQNNNNNNNNSNTENNNNNNNTSSTGKQRAQLVRSIRGPYPVERLVMHELEGGLAALFCQLNDSFTVASSFVLQFPKRPPAGRPRQATIITTANTSPAPQSSPARVAPPTHSPPPPPSPPAQPPQPASVSPAAAAAAASSSSHSTPNAGRQLLQAGASALRNKISLSLEYPRKSQPAQHRAARGLFGGRKAYSQRLKSPQRASASASASIEVAPNKFAGVQSSLVKSCSDAGESGPAAPQRSPASQLIGLVKQAQVRYKMVAQYHGIDLITFDELQRLRSAIGARDSAACSRQQQQKTSGGDHHHQGPPPASVWYHRHLDEAQYLRHSGEQHQMCMLSHGQHQLLARNIFHYKLESRANRIVVAIEARPIGAAQAAPHSPGQPHGPDLQLTAPLNSSSLAGGLAAGQLVCCDTNKAGSLQGNTCAAADLQSVSSYRSSALSSQCELSAISSSWAELEVAAAAAPELCGGDDVTRDTTAPDGDHLKRRRRPYFSRSTRAICGGTGDELVLPPSVARSRHQSHSSMAPLRRQQVIHTSSDQSSLLVHQQHQHQQLQQQLTLSDSWRSKCSLSTTRRLPHQGHQPAYGWLDYNHHSLPNTSKADSLDCWQRLSHGTSTPPRSSHERHGLTEQHLGAPCLTTASASAPASDQQLQLQQQQQQREPRTSSFELGNLRTDSHGRRPHQNQQFLAYGGHRSASAEVRSPVFVTLTSPGDDDDDDVSDNNKTPEPGDQGSVVRLGEHGVVGLDPACYQPATQTTTSGLPGSIRQSGTIACGNNVCSNKVLAHSRVGQVGDRIQGLARALSSWINNLNRRDSF